MTELSKIKARLATIRQMREHLENFITPVPSDETLRDWFDQARIPRFKANPAAKRGGGPVFYSVAAVEKLLQQRTMIKLPTGGRA